MNLFVYHALKILTAVGNGLRDVRAMRKGKLLLNFIIAWVWFNQINFLLLVYIIILILAWGDWEVSL